MRTISPQFIIHHNRDKRAAFEEFLCSEKSKMEAFRIKETKEFMSVDEMKDKCDATEKIMTVLEVNLSSIICRKTINHLLFELINFD